MQGILRSIQYSCSEDYLFVIYDGLTLVQGFSGHGIQLEIVDKDVRLLPVILLVAQSSGFNSRKNLFFGSFLGSNFPTKCIEQLAQ